MNYELEGKQKEAVVTDIKIIFRIPLEDSRKTTKSPAQNNYPIEIRNLQSQETFTANSSK